ncbi:MAG: hypothetical protein V3T86_05565, partial [Planctomycetota bacterium]
DTEIEFLREDVEDLLTIGFASAEQAFVGDIVFDSEVLQEPNLRNGYEVYYELPPLDRPGLGYGFGEALLHIEEDGVRVEDPLNFFYDESDAGVIRLFYGLSYDGETRGGRFTSIDFEIDITLTRYGAGWIVDYRVFGNCWMDDTYCLLNVAFRSEGRPSEGFDPTFGDGEGYIDDDGVYSGFDMDLDWHSDHFTAEGEVGTFGWFEEDFGYRQVL